MAFIKEGTHYNKTILHEALYNNYNIQLLNIYNSEKA